MGFFRAILAKQEISDRAFQLTKEVIRFSQGNYAAWAYRRKLIDALKCPLSEEFDWLNSIGLDMEKNYQIWHHRRCVAEIIGKDMDLEGEMAFLGSIFSSDAKNYHAWTYRIWLVERFQLWKDQMDFAENLLDDDVENNSIWSYRYFLLNASPVGTFSTHAPGTPEFVGEQLKYVMEQRWTERMDNEAMWVYLRGMLANSEEEAAAS
jgi:protein farnesyltransferase/geranylgeranyltransferase type-1 subunit alpha